MNTAVNEPLKQVLGQYNLGVNKITLENYKENRAVWWVDTNRGGKILKKMPVGKKRVLFVLSAMEHLTANGVNLPKIIRTKKKSPFVEIEGTVFVLSKAVSSTPPNYNVASQLAMIMRCIAGFHIASRGYQPPAEANIRSHLGIWPKTYLDQINALQSFKEQAMQNKAGKFNAAFLKECDFFINLADSCLAALLDSPYNKLVKAAGQTVNLCHQDFAARNLGLTNKGRLYVFDTDDITYDIPSRDIRKICNEVVKNKGRCDSRQLRQMLQAYNSVNPMTPEDYAVLSIDMRFPYLFYSIAKRYFLKLEKDWSEQKFLKTLINIINTERSKLEVLKAALPIGRPGLNP